MVYLRDMARQRMVTERLWINRRMIENVLNQNKIQIISQGNVRKNHES